ncbi:MAG: hypothetical protein KF726_00900 [Anaerolineae bacterium]|nr:hypothetical protein [Anaerolineae bacterium]
MSKIPDPEFVHETVNGAVYDLPEGSTLLIGTTNVAFTSYAPRLSGPLVLRYGISLLSPNTQAIIPGLFVSEKGVALVGREAWDFILERFQLYPRSDIIGIKAFGGAPLQVFLRELDFGTPVRIFAYESLDTSLLPAEISRVILGEDTRISELPELLVRYGNMHVG